MPVLVVGEALVDVVHHADGRVEEHAGGSPFNVAIGLARLGVETCLVSRIGDDARGHLLLTALGGAEVEHVLGAGIPGVTTSSAEALLGADGSATYTFALDWQVDELPQPHPDAWDAIHVGSLGTFLEPGASAVADLVVSADAMGVPVSFDPNVRLGVDADPEAWRAAFARIAPHARIIKLSDEDAAVIHPDVSPPDLARRLASEGALVAITQGAGGALVAHRDHLVVIEAPVIEVADTIGAGDSFMAAMLAWCDGYDWPDFDELDLTELHDLGDYAARAAAITCSRPGADPPWLEEV